MKTGTLYLIKSKYPPVFRTPMQITYMKGPAVGQSFLFSSAGHGRCNLSETMHLHHYDGFTVISTRNSFYVLTEKAEETQNA